MPASAKMGSVSYNIRSRPANKRLCCLMWSIPWVRPSIRLMVTNSRPMARRCSYRPLRSAFIAARSKPTIISIRWQAPNSSRSPRVASSKCLRGRQTGSRLPLCATTTSTLSSCCTTMPRVRLPRTDASMKSSMASPIGWTKRSLAPTVRSVSMPMAPRFVGLNMTNRRWRAIRYNSSKAHIPHKCSTMNIRDCTPINIPKQGRTMRRYRCGALMWRVIRRASCKFPWTLTVICHASSLPMTPIASLSIRWIGIKTSWTSLRSIRRVRWRHCWSKKRCPTMLKKKPWKASK